jgi:hypothetical protein
MPLGKGVRYRFTRQGGKNVRLAFRGNKVIERTAFKRNKKGKLVKAGKSRRIA